jgi:hypothetical protein
MSGPAFRLSAADLPATVDLVERTATEISRCLGFQA